MLRKVSDFFEESVEKSQGKESDNESDSKEFVNVFVRIRFGYTIEMVSLIANSFAISGMVIVEPGVRATIRSAAHMDRQFSDFEEDCFFDRMELFCFVNEVFDSEYVQVQNNFEIPGNSVKNFDVFQKL
ncbi:hypothetical protein Tco_1526320 [Tanacetum coccineum]